MNSSEFKCPYCDYKHDIGDMDIYETGEHEIECWGCEKKFVMHLDYEPDLTVRCADGEHDLVEYWIKNKWSEEDEVREEYPILASKLWCRKCEYREKKQ